MPPTKKEPQRYRCKEAFGTFIDGGVVNVGAGEIVRAGHPILEGRMHFFEPAEDFGRFDVEQTTAAPGEKRG